MNFCKRIIISLSIIIAVLVSKGWSAAPATHFDLPHDHNNPALDTPGYQFTLDMNEVTRNTLSGIANFQLVVDGNRLVWIKIPQAIDTAHVFFPEDGHQPTTKEAVSWSCANIDNREDSPITEWYMQMFGVIPVNQEGSFLKAGWSGQPNNSQPTKIIVFPIPTGKNSYNHYQINNGMIEDPDRPDNKISRMNFFQKQFRKIASTSVGRVLLYRLLIEIRRQVSDADTNGCLEKIEPPLELPFGGIGIRNMNRGVAICSGKTSYYSPTTNWICMREVRDVSKNPTVINQSALPIDGTTDNGYTLIEQSESLPHISLFHEMIHWYYYLRDPQRSNSEQECDNSVYEHYLGEYYWGDLGYHNSCLYRSGTRHDEERERVSFEYWSNFNEMRTILGSARATANYKEGDDLSENLYRTCVGFPLRFGHCICNFYEDFHVTHKVIRTTAENYAYYAKGYECPNDILLLSKKGLGNCRKP